MVNLSEIYMVILPLVLTAALVEGLWLARSRKEGYDWWASACSLADLAGRQLLRFVPLAIIAPWMAWAWDYRFFTQSLDNVGSVRNRGLEADLKASVLDTRNLRFDLLVNGSLNT